METHKVYRSEFKIYLNIGSECVELGIPSGEGLPNSISISMKPANNGNSTIVNTPVYVQPTGTEQAQPVIISRNEVPPETLTAEETSLNVEETYADDDEHPQNLPESLEELFNMRYKDKPHIYKHMCEALGKHVDFYDLTKPNLVKIKDHLLKVVTTNSAAMYMAIIKACMNLYSEEGVFNCKGFAKILRQKKIPSVNVYLTEEEMEKIENYKPKGRREQEVKNKFLIEYYTGARLSDVETLTLHNIKDDYITYISQKTKTLTKVPVHKNLDKLLKFIRLRPIERSIYNKVIKKICRNCGIDEELNIFYRGQQRMRPKWAFIGSHTARRSFATNLFLRNVPMQVISKMMGHNRDIKMTEKYILADIDSIDDNTLSFFK